MSKMLQKPRISVYERYVPAVEKEQEENQQAYWFVFAQDRLLVEDGSPKVSIPFVRHIEKWQIKMVRTQYLGTLEGHDCYSAEASADATAPEGMSFIALRSLYGRVDEDVFHIAGKALQIVAWDQTHQYCGRCGSLTASVLHERAKQCPTCGLISYPRLCPAVITAIIKDNQLLLARAPHFRGNMHGLISGFVEPGETLEDTVRREIMEEIGIEVTNIRYFGSQQWPFPNALMIGFVADYARGELKVDGKEIVTAGWFDPNHLPEIPSEISIARKMIDWYVSEFGTTS